MVVMINPSRCNQIIRRKSYTPAPAVAAELRFCPLLHIDLFETRNNILPGLFDLSTVCVHNKQLHFKADRGPFVLTRFSEQNEYRINEGQARDE